MDIPVATDIDNDGDLDILTFEIAPEGLFIALEICLLRIIIIVII